MSTVNTGMPAAFASWITGPMESAWQGLSTIADTLFTMKSLT